MKRPIVLSALAVVTALSSVSSNAQVQTPARNEPGMPTIARTFILNKNRSEAIPVNVQSTGDVLPVTVMGLPAVTWAPDATLGSRTARQGWEYRQLSVSGGADPTDSLNAAGLDGWEAISSTTPAPGRTMWILKRPR